VKLFETEVARIADVLAIRASDGGAGGAEVHVLASPGRTPEDIAADIRSLALLRGIDLAPEGIHVVQLQAINGEPEPDAGGGDGGSVDVAVEPAAEAGGPPASVPVVEEPAGVAEPIVTASPAAAAQPTGSGRVEIDGVVVVTAEGASRAIATVRRGDRVATGTAVFVPASVALRRGVAEATLRAVLELQRTRDDVAVDSAIVLPLHPHEVAVVSLAVVSAGSEDTLVGAVLVRTAGANDAIARAVLDATNRWFSRHDHHSA
jgi:hypothetical protein